MPFDKHVVAKKSNDGPTVEPLSHTFDGATFEAVVRTMAFPFGATNADAFRSDLLEWAERSTIPMLLTVRKHDQASGKYFRVIKEFADGGLDKVPQITVILK